MNSLLSHITASLQAVGDNTKVVIIGPELDQDYSFLELLLQINNGGDCLAMILPFPF